jgi:thymidylate synthase ThyX
MKIIKPGVEIITPINGMDILKTIELAGRTCYKSEDKITDESCVKFVKNILNRGHEAVREWRHFLKLRTSPAAHPQMREVAIILLNKFKSQIPVLFDDIIAEG